MKEFKMFPLNFILFFLNPDIVSSWCSLLSKFHLDAAHQIHHIPRAHSDWFGIFFSRALLTSLRELGSSPHHTEMPKSGTRTPNLPPPTVRPAQTSQSPSTGSGIRWGLGQVDYAAMKEPSNDQNRGEEREERRMAAMEKRRRRRGERKRTSKTTTITARKQTTGRKQVREKREEQKKLRGTQGPRTN